MTPRTVAQFLRDKRISQSAQYDYRFASRELASLAVDYKAAGEYELARDCRLYAFVTANAARAEFFDTEPVPPVKGLASKAERPPWSVGP